MDRENIDEHWGEGRFRTPYSRPIRKKKYKHRPKVASDPPTIIDLAHNLFALHRGWEIQALRRDEERRRQLKPPHRLLERMSLRPVYQFCDPTPSYEMIDLEVLNCCAILVGHWSHPVAALRASSP